ncbi:MAG: response regulator [Legionella sp.]
MAQPLSQGNHEDAFATHQFYMDILNCMPNIVYWVDNQCNLKGCNNNFVKLVGLKQTKDFVGTPYEQMTKFAHWSEERATALKLDDMKVLFSGRAEYNITEPPVYNNQGDVIHYLATRVPLYDSLKHLIGLVVILSENNNQTKSAEIKPVLIPGTDAANCNSHPLNVLMVEDNFIAQKVEEALLTSLNCHVDIADSGDKAISLFNPGKYDIVFMDISLADTSGYMVAKQLRELEKNTNHHVPIIALTSYQAEVVMYDCNDYFMEGVITKPMTQEQANQIIKHYVYHENIEVNGLKSVK